MPSRTVSVPRQVATDWSEVTGCPLDPEDGPGDPEVDVPLPRGRLPHVSQVPEPTASEQEIERPSALGAALDDDRRESDGTGWTVLAAPESNGFRLDRPFEPAVRVRSSSSSGGRGPGGGEHGVEETGAENVEIRVARRHAVPSVDTLG